MTVVSAPAGSGKTVLLRSCLGEAGLTERAAWVPVGRDERDIAAAVLFAMTSTFLTGQTLHIDGGEPFT